MNPEQYTEPEEYSVFEEMEQNAPLNYAGLGQRFANYIIDIVVFYLSAIIFGIILGLIQRITGSEFLYDFLLNDGGSGKIWEYVFGFTVFIITYTLIEGATRGRSLGKLITGTKAVTEDGEKITWGMAFKRSLCRIIPFEPLSALGGTPWHDKWTKTTVVKIR